MTTTTIRRPLEQPEADTIARVLWGVEHIAVAVHVGAGHHIDLQPTREALTTFEEVTALRAVTAVTDAPVRWNPAVTHA